MSTIDPHLPLRRALLADGLISGAMGLALLAGAGLVAGLLGLPEALLRGAGLALLPFAASLLWLTRQAVPNAMAAKVVIGLNVAWVGLSLVLLVSGWVRPTPLGDAFVIGQGLAVACFGILQSNGLHRTAASASRGQPASA